MVLAIIAVLASIGAPLFSGWVAQLRTDEAAQAFERALLQARQEALARGQRVVVAPSSDGSWNNGWVVFVDADLDGALGGTDTTLSQYQNADAVPVNAHFGDVWGSYISFLPGGYVRGGDGEPLAGYMSFGPAEAAVSSVCLSQLGRVQRVKGTACPG